MNYMPVIGMITGMILGWMAKDYFEYWKEKYNGIDKRDAERAVCIGKSCEQKD